MSISGGAAGRAALASLPASLPAPVARFVAVAGPRQPTRIETAVLDTAGWMRRPGIPPIPLDIRMSHVLGEAFVHDIRIGRRPVSFRFGLDAYVDGRGVVRIGRSLRTGPAIDQGALIAMWGEALVFVASWIDRADIGWEPLDAGSARLIVPGPTGPIPITVEFDPASGLPSACHAERHKDEGGLTPWTGTWQDWRIRGGVLAPRRLGAAWSDEPRPWLDLHVRAVAFDLAVDDERDRVRRIRQGMKHSHQRDSQRGST